MNDRSVTHTVLARHDSNPFGNPTVTGMIDCHSYDHAEQEFEMLNPDETILGIYEGDLSWRQAMDRYHEENRK